ncbi:hypothetical protein BH09MYX1_BH09MYX1_07120 [soil metagenome]
MKNPVPATEPTDLAKAQARTLQQMASLYRSELAAMETYTRALCHASLVRYTNVLQRQKRVHQERVTALSTRLQDLGAPLPASSGAWGTFVRITEEAAASFSPELALAVLEEEEDTLARDYLGSLEFIDATSRTLVSERLLPAQNVTHHVVRRIHEDSAA